MPQLQTVDFTPPKRTTTTPFEKFLSSFGEATVKRQEENQDIQGYIDLYKKQKETGGNIEKAMQNIFTQPGLSPTARVNAAKNLMNMEEINQSRQKQADAKLVAELKVNEKEETQRLKDIEKETTKRTKSENELKKANLQSDKATKEAKDLAGSNRSLLSSIPGITPEQVEQLNPDVLSSQAAHDIYANRTKAHPATKGKTPEDKAARIESQRAALDALPPGTLKEGEAEKYANLEKDQFNQVLKLKTPKEHKPTAVENKMALDAYEKVNEAHESLAKIEGSEAVIDRILELADETSGAWETALSGLGLSPEFAEMKSLGLEAMQPIVKAINPSGVLAVAKTKIVMDAALPKWYDTKAVIVGKMKALSGFIKKAKAFENRRIELYSNYKGSPPREEVKTLDQLTEAAGDEMLGGLEKNVKEESVNFAQKDRLTKLESKKPASSVPEGTIINDAVSGFKFKSDGKQWRVTLDL